MQNISASDFGELSPQRQSHIKSTINNLSFQFHTHFVMLQLMTLTSAIFTDELLTDEQLCYHANNGYATLLQHIKKAIEPNDNEQLLTLIITDKWFIYNFAMDIKLVNAVYPHFNGNPYCISFNVIWKLFFAAFEIIDLEAVFYNNTASLFIEHTILAFMKYAKNKQNLPFIRDAPELEPDIAYALSKKCVTFPLKVHTLGIWNKPSYVEEISATDSNGNAALLKTLMFPYVVETAYYAVYRNKHYIWFDSPRRHVCGVSSGNTFGIAAIVSAWVCSRMAVETDLAKIAARTA
jgi:hypothetical protein